MGKNIILVIILFFLSWCIYSQNSRPIPYPVEPHPNFKKAVENKTRTLRGLPGEKYWTNFANYQIQAVLSPDRQLLQGQEKVIYYNNSPDTLRQIVVQLYQNLNKAESNRLRTVSLTSGMHISFVKVDGITQIENDIQGISGYEISGTQMIISLSENLLPGSSLQLEFSWHFKIPQKPNPRMGQDGDVFFLGYWYPQVAVYDDVNGWDLDNYLGHGEFYMGFADYDVRITLPSDYLVGATGELKNAAEILSQQSLDRLQQVKASENTVTIVGFQDRQLNSALKASKNHQHTWHFKAKNLRDFAFGASKNYVWDASYAVVDQSTGRKAIIHALYRPERKLWKQAAHYGQHSLEFLSDQLWPYPWSQMTLIEGLLSGGMEYPMITLIGVDSHPYSLYSVIVHEIGHMWFPMIVGTDEKSFNWMDEGFTRYHQNYGLAKYFPEIDPWHPKESRAANYYRIANSGNEFAPMQHRDRFPINGEAGGAASYAKPAIGLRALGAIYGDDIVNRSLEEYGNRWQFKHPTPHDLFNTFEELIGEDLDWFWSSWFYNTWTLDHAVSKVTEGIASSLIQIEDKGLLPFPVIVEITYAGGDTEVLKVPVEHWLKGQRSYILEVSKTGILKVLLDPDEKLPDLDRSNNLWLKD
jgi:hypothetical protein